MVTTKEIEILTTWNSQDISALHEIHSKYHAALSAYAKALTGGTQDAGDIVNQAYINCWKAKKKFSSLGKLRSYLFTTVLNLFRQTLRNDGRKKKVFDKLQYHSAKYAEIDNYLIDAEVYRIVMDHIQHLAPQARLIFTLTLRDGLTTDEIAMRIGTTTKNVLNHKRIGANVIRNLLKKNNLLSLLTVSAVSSFLNSL